MSRERFLVNKFDFLYFWLEFFVTVLFSIIFLGSTSIPQVGNVSVILAFIILIVNLLLIYKRNKTILTPTVLFLISYYLFQNGQLLLTALGIEFNDFYLSSLSQYYNDVAVFSSISTVIASGIAVVMSRNRIQEVKNYSVDSYNPKSRENAICIGFFLTCLIAIPLIAIKFITALSGGYGAVRILEGRIPSPINFIEYMFMPFAVLSLIYCRKGIAFYTRIIVIIWLILTALTGDRTTGIAGLLIVAYISFCMKEQNENSYGSRLASTIKLLAVGAMLIVFIRIAYLFRNQNDITLSMSVFDYLVEFVSELGFSSFSLYTMFHVVPSCESFLYGVGYIKSFIGGLIPSFIDPTGIIRQINSESRIFATWQARYFPQYSFGLGFSLNAEAYINFGWYGLIAIAIICIIVFSFLGKENLKERRNGWGLYKVCILLFLWFTLPRRDSYYIWKALSYGIVAIKLYLHLFCCRK